MKKPVLIILLSDCLDKVKNKLASSILICSIFLSQEVYSQLENTIWYFGQTNGVTFTPPTYTPVTLNAHATFSGNEGCGIATDPINGQVLFYTDGISLYDASNNLMSGMGNINNNLGGDPSAAQAVAFCKAPGDCNKYYVFANSSVNSASSTALRNIYVYVVDMTGNSGLGTITPIGTNNVLYSKASESMTILPIAGTNEFWLTGKIYNIKGMYAFRIGTAFQSNYLSSAILQETLISTLPIGATFNMEYTPLRTQGQGNVAIAYPGGSIYTLGLDPSATGGSYSTSVTAVVTGAGNCYDVEWSPNGSLLYYSNFTNPLQLFQNDLSGTNTLLHTGGSGISGGGLKTGPDGRIYFIANRNSRQLGVINSPDTPGAGCAFNPTQIDFPTAPNHWQGSYNLPVTLPKTNYTITSNIPGGGNTICPGTPVTLTANDGASFLWNVGGYTTSSVTVTPTAPLTTYTVQIRDLNNCLLSPISFTVLTDVCICGTAIGTSGTIASNFGNTSTNVYKLNNYVTISGNRTFTDAEFIMAPDVRITVPSGAQLNLTNVHLYACSSMWDGIVLENGGKLNIISTSTTKQNLIEDAKIAIDYSKASASAASTSVLKIENTVFNKNHISLRLYNHSGTYFYNNFSFKNNVLTSRDIIFSPNSDYWNVTDIRNPYNPESGNPHSEQNTVEANYKSTVAKAFLKEPYVGEKPLYGIEMKDVGTFSNLSPKIVIGTSSAATFNLFDNLNTAVYGLNSSFDLIANRLQNSKINSLNAYGVFAQNNQTTFSSGNFVKVDNNTFVNMHTGILASNNTGLAILNNTFRSNRQETNLAATPNHPGKAGIQLSNKYFSWLYVRNNKLYNIETGISFTGLYGLLNGTNQQLLGEFEIKANIIRRSIVDNNPFNGSVRNAIVLNNVGASSNYPNNSGANAKISIINNTIQDVYRAIRVNGFKNRKILIDNQYPTTPPGNYPPVTRLAQSPVVNDVHFGVQFTNNVNSQDSKHIIKNMNIVWYGFPYAKTYGIYLEMSERTKVVCNSVANTYHGLYFKGSNPVVETSGNLFQGGHQYGFTLDDNAIIGQQGSTANSTGNKFYGLWPAGTFRTATLNFSSAINSKMYVKDNAIENPNNNGFVDGTGTANVTNYYNNGSAGSTLIYEDSDAKSCASFALTVQPQHPNDLRIIHEREHFKKIINHEVIFEMNPEERERVARQQIYTVLRLNPDLMENEAVLQAFFNEHEQGNIGKIDRIERALEGDDLVLAATETEALVPENEMDARYKRFYEIYLAFVNGGYSESDNADLFAIASACPQLDGAVVFQARALYESLNGNNYIIEGACLGEGLEIQAKQIQAESLEKPDESLEVSPEITDLLVYPNPAKDKFYVTAKNIQGASIALYDQQGRSIEVDVTVLHEHLIELSNNLSPGIYVIHIKTGKEKILKKITIE